MKRSIIAIIIVVILVLAGISAFEIYNASKPKTNLPTFNLVALSPENSITSYELSVISSDLNNIGIHTQVKLVTSATYDSWTTVNATPRFADLGWFPAWPDPVYQQFMATTGVQFGGIGGNLAWLDNSTLQNMYPQIAFQTNKSQQIQNLTKGYQVVYNQAPYVWLPNPDQYFFEQPYVKNFTYNSFVGYWYNMMQYDAQGSSIPLPANSSQLVDAIQPSAPDSLDPATGEFIQDGPVLAALYQQLVEFNGTSVTQVVPVLAKNYSTSNYQNFTFNIRNGVQLSDGSGTINATTFWFSLYRTILMGQGPGIAYYINFLFNGTQYANTGFALPFGIENALTNAGYNLTGNATQKASQAANYLAYILSHFSTLNTSDYKVMEYPNQAVSVNASNLMQLHINILVPYRFFLYVIAPYWGSAVSPTYIDAHGGVVPNTPNSYANLNGIPGTGPYVIKNVGSSLSTITLEKNKNYWANGLSNVTPVAQSPHINQIILEYGISHSNRVSGFLDNSIQLSYVSQSYISQIANATNYKAIPFNQYFANFGAPPGVLYLSMNTQRYPTNITDFRLAIVHAINYTQLDAAYNYNGQLLAQNYLGPISPNFASEGYYNPGNLQPYSYNVTLAEKYLSEAGKQGHFFVTTPTGSVLGDVALVNTSNLSNISEVIPIAATARELVISATKNYF
jgi:peptide/nickel transport system substrate-binding protein